MNLCNRPKNDNIPRVGWGDVRNLQLLYPICFVLFTIPDCADCKALESAVKTVMRNASISMNNVVTMMDTANHHRILAFKADRGRPPGVIAASYTPTPTSNLEEFLTGVNSPRTCPVVYNNIEATINDVGSLDQIRVDHRVYIIIYTEYGCQTCLQLKQTISEIKFSQPLLAVKTFEFTLPRRSAATRSTQSIQTPIDPMFVIDTPLIVKYIFGRGGFQGFRYTGGLENKDALRRFMAEAFWTG